MKMASRKKNSPSTANGIPNAPPYRPISTGHSSPISNDRTVPVTAPTANVTAITVDQRRASSSAAGSPAAEADPVRDQDDVGSPTPRQASTMWNPSVNAIWDLAASSSAETVGSMSESELARPAKTGNGRRRDP